MIKENNNWFYYKKILTFVLYCSIAVLGVIMIYYSVEYFFNQTFTSKGVQYETYRSGYTTEPGTDPVLVDKNKWKKQTVDRSWNVPMFNAGFVHPLVALTIASIIVVAIIGGIVVLRSQTKHPHR